MSASTKVPPSILVRMPTNPGYVGSATFFHRSDERINGVLINLDIGGTLNSGGILDWDAVTTDGGWEAAEWLEKGGEVGEEMELV